MPTRRTRYVTRCCALDRRGLTVRDRRVHRPLAYRAPRRRPRPMPGCAQRELVSREWARIGCIGFGGPPAHIALLRELRERCPVPHARSVRLSKASAFSRSRPQPAATVAPCPIKLCQIAAPMPRVPPVTNATRPSGLPAPECAEADSEAGVSSKGLQTWILLLRTHRVRSQGCWSPTASRTPWQREHETDAA